MLDRAVAYTVAASPADTNQRYQLAACGGRMRVALSDQSSSKSLADRAIAGESYRADWRAW
jgi:hypothetical protein